MAAQRAARWALLSVCCSAVLAASPGTTGSGHCPAPLRPALAFALAPPACGPGGAAVRTWAAPPRTPALAAAAHGGRCRVRGMLGLGLGAVLAMAAGEGGAAPAGKQSTHARTHARTRVQARMCACMHVFPPYIFTLLDMHARVRI